MYKIFINLTILFNLDNLDKLIIIERQQVKLIFQVMSKESNLKIYEMLTALFVTISKGQQILDSIKQVLTTFDLFHPLVLFKYLTKGNPILQPKNILTFLQENNYSAKEQDIKIIFSFEGVKQKMNYSTFLKMVYPYSMTANREITTVHFKNYYATENLPINQEILACFFLLITEHVQLINKIEVQKQDSLSTIPRQKISKVLRNIKKLSEKSASHCQRNANLISGLELIYFIKNFTTIQDSSLLYLLRRLGTNHLGSIQIQKLEAFVKPWKKKQPTTVQDQDQDQEQNQSIGKRFNEQKYRKQLNSQLQRSISNKKNQNLTKRKSRRQGSIKIKQGQFCQKKTQQKSGRKNPSTLKTPVKQSLTSNKKRQKFQSQIQQKSANKDLRSHQTKLFIKFIEVFLKNSFEIERLKQQLNNGNQINYLKIFKNLDKDQRGIVRAQELQGFYKQMGGGNISINFNILIEGFSQNGQNWLSYSQFCQIFKPSIERTDKSRSNNTYSAHQTSQSSQRTLFSQILYLTLMNEYELLQIRRQFSKQQLFHLFGLINKEQTGFINYQQLKYFLAQNMATQLSMYELMLVLKRLDKCKNGVVSENQFVDYFLVKM